MQHKFFRLAVILFGVLTSSTAPYCYCPSPPVISVITTANSPTQQEPAPLVSLSASSRSAVTMRQAQAKFWFKLSLAGLCGSLMLVLGYHCWRHTNDSPQQEKFSPAADSSPLPLITQEALALAPATLQAMERKNGEANNALKAHAAEAATEPAATSVAQTETSHPAAQHLTATELATTLWLKEVARDVVGWLKEAVALLDTPSTTMDLVALENLKEGVLVQLWTKAIETAAAEPTLGAQPAPDTIEELWLQATDTTNAEPALSETVPELWLQAIEIAGELWKRVADAVAILSDDVIQAGSDPRMGE